MINRLQRDKLQNLHNSFPIVCIIGPRQSGKTTLAKTTFPDYLYVSLEDLDNREFATSDPRGFLNTYQGKTIIDEVQRVPELLSYLQTQVDNTDQAGQYILTGSAHLNLLESLSQSLAGRVALLKLLPLSAEELTLNHCLKENMLEQLFTGFYPRIYKHQLNPCDWYPNYIQTYLEKDVRAIAQLKDLQLFRKFIGLCAGRHGQSLDITSLSNDCGISRQTVYDWLSILEVSFLIYFLQPYHKNFNKRLTKSPKLYFYDSGLVCSLLKIENSHQLQTHYLRGAIFEGYVITEIMKHRYNLGLEPHVYFWRDNHGNEVDCIIDSQEPIAVEVKSGTTLNNDFFKGLTYWKNLTGIEPHHNFLIYGGNTEQKREIATVLPWNQVEQVFY